MSNTWILALSVLGHGRDVPRAISAALFRGVDTDAPHSTRLCHHDFNLKGSIGWFQIGISIEF